MAKTGSQQGGGDETRVEISAPERNGTVDAGAPPKSRTLRGELVSLCIVFCALYSFMLITAFSLSGYFLVTENSGDDGAWSRQELWELASLIGVSVFMGPGLLSTMILLMRYSSGGSSALRLASLRLWIFSAFTIIGMMILIVPPLIDTYTAGSGEDLELGWDGAIMCSVLLVFPFLLYLRRFPGRD
jgi:hypothetical protein